MGWIDFDCQHQPVCLHKVKLWTSRCPFLHQRYQARVQIGLHVMQGQIVWVVTKWHLQFRCNVIYTPIREDNDKVECTRPPSMGHGGSTNEGEHGPMEQKHYRDHLGKGERNAKLCDLPCIIEIHNAIAQLVVNPRQDWRCNGDSVLLI